MIRLSLRSDNSETSHEFFLFVESESAGRTPNENNNSNAETHEYDCLRIARAEAHGACARVRPFSRRPPVSGWEKIKEKNTRRGRPRRRRQRRRRLHRSNYWVHYTLPCTRWSTTPETSALQTIWTL